MHRAVKVSQQWLTLSKKGKLDALYYRFKHAVNFYINSLWKDKGGLNAKTLARLQYTELTERQKSQALKQALEIVINTKKSSKALKKKAKKPYFDGYIKLDAKLVSVERVREANSFNIAIRVSTLDVGNRTTILTKKTRVVDKWLAWKDARIIDGCGYKPDSRIILWIEIPIPERKREKRIVR